MIVRMKKITMIVPEKDQQHFLVRLRKEGVVHIKSLKKPSDRAITLMEEKGALFEKAISILSQYHAGGPEKDISQLQDNEILDKVEEIISAQHQKEGLSKDIHDTISRIAWYKPWGEFGPEDLTRLREKGIYVNLYRLTKSEFRKIKSRGNVYVIAKDGGYVYVAGLFYKQDEGFPFEEVKLQAESYGELRMKLEGCQRERDEKEKFLQEQAVFKKGLEGFIKKLQKKRAFLNVFFGMHSEEGLSVLQGFCPAPDVCKVVSLARQNDFGYLIEEPDNEEQTPTLIKNPRWINIINPVFKFMNTLPGYSEYDISSVFLIFFSLFFAMLIGDAGYGLVLIGLTWLIRKKAKNIPAEPFRLMYLMGSATVIWGAVTGTWFGLEQIAQLPVFNALVIEKINSFAENNENYMIYICFIIGVIQISIAHIMRFIRMINSLKALAQIGWIAVVWGLFFVAGTLVVDKPFPPFAGYLLGIGITLVLVFSNPQKNIFKGILNSFIDVPLTVISSFSDIISYLRLFAVGYATVAVASSFNSMAMIAGFDNIIRGLGAALILFLGHGLNIILGLMAVIVHGIRLNMLEFSGHLNMQWSGKEYVPFAES